MGRGVMAIASLLVEEAPVAPAESANPSSAFSDSELSCLSRSPTPPSEPSPMEDKEEQAYISPPSSQQSLRGTPCLEGSTSGSSSSAEDETRPAKRRRVTRNMPRETKKLDLDQLSQNSDPEQQAELDRLLNGLKKKRKIVVVAGAGISVSAGIPDFRSSTGLFNSLKAQHNLKGSGKHLFDAAVYRDGSSTSSFHQMVCSLYAHTKVAAPTPFHHLLAGLAEEGRLLRLYSQNVDGIDTSLEPLATQVPLPRKGPWPKTIQLHGGLEKMICTKCQNLSDFRPELFEGPTPPECGQCRQMDLVRTEVAGKRSHGVGRLRPRMVLYNEHNPDDEAIGAVTKADLRRRPDAIIVVGTTLKVPGVKRIVREMCGIVRDHRDGLAVWINNDPEPTGKEFENCWDLIVKGTCDDVANHATLKQWQDVEVDTISEDYVQQVKDKSSFEVVVNTPSKCSQFKDFFAPLPTPLDSPRAESHTSDKQLTAEDISEAPAKKIAVSNPASKGRSLDQVLNPPSKTTAKEPAKRGRKPKTETSDTIPKGKATGTQSTTQSDAMKTSAPSKKQQANAKPPKLSFKLTKPTSASSAKISKTGSDGLIKSEPLLEPKIASAKQREPLSGLPAMDNVQSASVFPALTKKISLTKVTEDAGKA